ncbi:MAG: hypothetical protein DCC67_12680 [Planctomycetota bacterium]|nr:MAG: hypothetical protein DCC67_12680 [Planctomycetota bacterium]
MKATASVVAAVLALTAAHDTAGQAVGQSVGSSQVSAIMQRNSASAYSASQIQNSIINRALPRYGTPTNYNRGLLSNAFSTRQQPQRPFSNVQRGTNVTPYIGLLSENPFNSPTTNYFALVRPQLEQQRMNERIQQQNIAMQRRLNDIAAMAPYDPSGSERMAPTGHAAVFMNFGGYYPQVAPSRR